MESRPGESCEFAILDNNAEILYAAPAAAQLFGVKDRADLQRALGGIEGPNARRLRHLASTLPIGDPPRLERMRFSLGRVSRTVNILCARVSAPRGGTALALSVQTLEKEGIPAEQVGLPAGSDTPGSEPAHADPFAPLASVADRVDRAPHPGEGGRIQGRSRFLWTIDSDGRFGAPDPVLIAALGAAAPQPGETPERLMLRTEIEHAGELAAMIEKRETFSGLALFWRRKGEDRKLRLTLSAAPTFDSRRAFAGYRGFGFLDEFEQDR